jgi:hypothetical protein
MMKNSVEQLPGVLDGRIIAGQRPCTTCEHGTRVVARHVHLVERLER